MSLRIKLSCTDSISASHQYTFQLNPSNCTWILFFTVEMRFRHYATWNTERPLRCFSSQLGFLLNRTDQAALATTSPSPDSIVSHLAHLFFLPSATVSCYFMRESPVILDADLSEKRSLEGAPHGRIGFQLSGPRGGFPFRNVSPVNMSPGWKVIPWKTGRMFWKTCCWSLYGLSDYTHTHSWRWGLWIACQADVLSVYTKQPCSVSASLLYSIIRFTQRFSECDVAWKDLHFSEHTHKKRWNVSIWQILFDKEGRCVKMVPTLGAVHPPRSEPATHSHNEVG